MPRKICTCDERGQCDLCKLTGRVETLEEMVTALLKSISDKRDIDRAMLDQFDALDIKGGV